MRTPLDLQFFTNVVKQQVSAARRARNRHHHSVGARDLLLHRVQNRPPRGRAQ